MTKRDQNLGDQNHPKATKAYYIVYYNLTQSLRLKLAVFPLKCSTLRLK